jgi:lipopolysaccharide transport system permease protein
MSESLPQSVTNKNLSLLVSLTKREFKLRYLGSFLGSYWNLIHPLMMIIIYTVIFSRVMKAKLGGEQDTFAYSIYLCSGIFAWNLFSEVVNRCSMSLIENAGFLKKIALPPFIVFGASFLSALVNFCISFAIFSLFLFFARPVDPLNYILAILVTALLGLFGLGMGVFLGCLNVFLRDVQQMIALLFQLWFWFTPIVYLNSVLPDFAQKILLFNPAFPFIESLHILIFQNALPPLKYAFLMLLWTSIFGAIAWYTYKKSISLIRDNL